MFDVSSDIINNGVSVADLCAGHTQVFASKGELRRLTQGGGLSINKDKIDNPDTKLGKQSLLNDKYLFVQKGKKNYFMIRVV